jgi:hypothetical protein
MGVDRIDFVWIHDIAQDFHADEWIAQFESARKGAFRALTHQGLGPWSQPHRARRADARSFRGQA